jgi:hypothetical protein
LIQSIASGKVGAPEGTQLMGTGFLVLGGLNCKLQILGKAVNATLTNIPAYQSKEITFEKVEFGLVVGDALPFSLGCRVQPRTLGRVRHFSRPTTPRR